MNFLHKQGSLLIFLINSVISSTLAWPILNAKVKTNDQELHQPDFISELRLKRQIVQPSWLNNGRRDSAIDATVHVNPQSISETAEIRKLIQTAVAEDSFAVNDEQQNTNGTTEESFSTLLNEKTNAAQAVNGVPNWFRRIEIFCRHLKSGLLKVFRN